MGANSSGGMGAARGEGHQARCFAWAAAYLLTEERLPDFALGRRVRAIGAQTGRAVDDLAIRTDEDGWLLVQAKKGLRLTSSPAGDLAAALGQAVRLAATGLPDGSGAAGRHRPVDPARDRVLIVSDETATSTVGRDLSSVVERLRVLPDAVPLDEAASNQHEHTGLAVLRRHLGDAWRSAHSEAMSDADFRTVCRSLGVRVLDLSGGGRHRVAAEQLLRGVFPAGEVAALWDLLTAEGHRAAQEGTYLDRGELGRRLAAHGFALSPVARLRPDIQRLRHRTTTNLELLGRNRAISAPDGVVDVDRSALAHLADIDGNVAITGGSGTGKSTELHRAAVAAHRRGLDVVVLRADDLRGTEGRTRHELNLDHDLAEVLLGWSGADGATLMLDGLDQTRGEDVSGWLSTVAHRLAGTRWRIVATIRSYDLRNGHRWREVFAGPPADPAHADPALADHRHLRLGDFTDAEVALASAQSARLGAVLTGAGPGLRALLANPFNLDMAAQLLGSGDLDLSTVHRRIDLLRQFWQVRAYRHDSARIVVLRAVVTRMVAAGRQVTGTDVGHVDHAALRSLCSDGVLRELPLLPGHAAPDVEFTHPVLFDYAAALFALGDPARPASLADVLGDHPNLALVLRAAIEFRLATIWRQDDTRTAFWRLGARLATRGSGHAIVAAQAAQLAVAELRTEAECAELARLCTAAASPDGPEGARQLAHLVAVLADGPEVAGVVAGLAERLADDPAQDLEVAQLAAQISWRLTGLALDERLAAVAARCAGLALAQRHHPTSPRVAESACQVLARVATAGRDTAGVLDALCGPDVVRAWGVDHLRPLVDRIADVARVDPGVAATVCVAVWEADTHRLSYAGHDIRADVGRALTTLTDAGLTTAVTVLRTALGNGTGPKAAWLADDPAPPHDDTEPRTDGVIQHLLRSVEHDDGRRAPAVAALLDAWPGPMDDGLRMSVAARLAHEPEVTPARPPGPAVHAFLRSVPLPKPVTDELYARFAHVPTFLALPGTPDVEALGGLVALACRAEWRAAHPDLTSLLTPYPDSPDTAHRYVVSRALPHLLPAPTDPVDELGRRLATEPNSHVAAVLLQVLQRHLGGRAADVDALLGRLVFDTAWARPLLIPDPHDHVGQEIVDTPFSFVAELAVAHGTANAVSLVEMWLDRPDRCHQQIGHLVHSLREMLDGTRGTAQRAAFALLERGARACRDALRAPDPGDDPADDRADDVHWAAAAIGHGVRLAADRGAGAPFADLALPVLRTLSAIPAATQSIVYTCVIVADHRPREVLTILADAVTGDDAFGRRPHGMTGIIALARRYLADHRGLLRDDETCLTALRRLIEVFILTGWDHAVALTEELDDLFR